MVPRDSTRGGYPTRRRTPGSQGRGEAVCPL